MSRLTAQGGEKLISKQNAELVSSEKGKLIITELDDKIIAFLVRGSRLICATVLDPDDIGPDDIIMAVIKDVKKDIAACFIEYAEGCDGYLPLSRIPDGVNVKQGSVIPVKLFQKAQKGKRAGFTARIDYRKYKDPEELKERAKHLGKFNYVYRSESTVFKTIDKVFKRDEYDEIVTDITVIKDLISGHFSNVRFYEDSSFSLNKLYSLRTLLDEALARKVWLKSGGFLIFDHTEALTVIDVNSGKAVPSKSKDKEAATVELNKEAAIEVCRQLRLRNLSGIMIADFINMNDEADKEEILEILRSESEKDTEKVMVIDFTPLGLAEITRKKELPPLYEQLN